MPIDKDKQTIDIFNEWNKLILREPLNISEMQLSSLSSWAKDCEDSFKEIYLNSMVKIANAFPDDYETFYECVVEVYWHLNHIKQHIIEAEDGFKALMEMLSSKLKE